MPILDDDHGASPFPLGNAIFVEEDPISENIPHKILSYYILNYGHGHTIYSWSTKNWANAKDATTRCVPPPSLPFTRSVLETKCYKSTTKYTILSNYYFRNWWIQSCDSFLGSCRHGTWRDKLASPRRPGRRPAVVENNSSHPHASAQHSAARHSLSEVTIIY